ncbi:Uncharacterized protein FWK35_00009176 [Aphis craccivora]|uniref:Reverse transcriptase domain-containing protein n=1 Tax=Aphis craccivora TaxID=307492 RepID=A0A6G0ZG62_APHCR|nr:Uncharacterized protein FWK35_00009176 [Aphis craccivora]
MALLKPGKSSMEASSYRPVSLLSVSYKLLERLILNRIQPTLDKHIPIEQAGFRNNRGCVEQVLALTTLIEAEFQRILKTNVVFIDLSAAYDTVWREGLMQNFINIVPCKRMSELLNNMLVNRMFQVFMDGKKSSTGQKFQFTDDIAIAHTCKDMKEGKNTLTNDFNILERYFHKWRLRPNPDKTEVYGFHLNNKEANRELNAKLKCIKYGAPVWSNSAHTGKVDTLLNSVMRLISGVVHSTPIPWLSVFSNIAPPEIRRNEALMRLFIKTNSYKNSILYKYLENVPDIRLKSRKPPWVKARDLIQSQFCSATKWQEETGHGRCGHMMFKRKLKDSQECDCGNDSENMRHITDECPNRRFELGINGINEVTKEAFEWIKDLDIEI